MTGPWRSRTKGTRKQRGKRFLVKPRRNIKVASVLTPQQIQPRVIHHTGWPPPEGIVKEIKQEWKQNPNRTTASDTEALAYMATASSVGPLSGQAYRIYCHVFYKYTKKKGTKTKHIDFVTKHKTLSEYDQRELRHLKDWIYKQQKKDMAFQRKQQKT